LPAFWPRISPFEPKSSRFETKNEGFFGGRPTAVLQLLYSEAMRLCGFFLKKKPPSTELVRAYVLENRSKSDQQ
jgi:hypothetical protein